MNVKVVAGILIALTQAAALPAALAADNIRPGKWEYTVTTQMPNLPQPPPGVQLPPNVQVPAGGMTATHTSCVTSSDPIAELSKPHGPAAAQSRCNVEKADRSGNTVSWITVCTIPEGNSRSQGAARYSGDRMEANTTTRTTRQSGPSIDVTNHIVGRYLGPCDGR